METLFHDARFALRGLLKRPAFTAVAVMTLALGIGANSSIFSVVYNVLLAPLPYRQPERLVALFARNDSQKVTLQPLSYPNFNDLREQNQVFDQLVAVRGESFSLLDEGEPERINGVRVSAGAVTMLGVEPVAGRGFLEDEDQPSKASVALISYGLWQRRYGGQPAVVGKSVLLDGRAYTVVGVLPSFVKYPGLNVPVSGADVWIPLVPQPNEQVRSFANLRLVGRLKQNVRLEQAQAEIDVISARLQQQYPQDNTSVGFDVLPLHGYLVRRVRPALIVLLCAVVCVLLIACANVANLLLARAAGRRSEMALRTALGASRRQLIRQLLTESVVLSLFGGVAGLLLAYWGVPLLMGLSANSIPRVEEVGVDLTVLGFTLLTALLTGILFGIAPAIQSSRTHLVEELKEGRKGGSGVVHGRLLGGLVVSEVAIALVLLVGAGLMIRSFRAVSAIDPGFNPDGVLTIAVPLPLATYKDQAAQLAFYDRALVELKATPGVQSAGGVFRLPISGFATVIFTVQGQPVATGSEPSADYRAVTADYFRAMGIRLLNGREFTERDTSEAPDAVIVNEELARRFWPNEDPIGRFLQVGLEKTRWRQVVGVVANAKLSAIDSPVDPAIYIPFPQNSWPMALRTSFLVVRANTDPKTLIGTVRRELQAIDPNLPVTQIRTMEEILSESRAQRRFNMSLLVVFAVIAALLAAIGIYGVMSYSVSQRSHELGIRIALGAQPSDIVSMVVGEGVKLGAIGIGIGLPAAIGATRLMTGLLYGVGATDPATFAVLVILLAGTTLLASYLPARKALRVDPMTALR